MMMMKTIMMLWLMFGVVFAPTSPYYDFLCRQLGGSRHAKYISMVNFFYKMFGDLYSAMYMQLGLAQPDNQHNPLFALIAHIEVNGRRTLHVRLSVDDIDKQWLNSSIEDIQLAFAFQGIAGRHKDYEVNLCSYSYPLAMFRCHFAFNVVSRSVRLSKQYPHLFPNDFRPSLAFQYEPDLSSRTNRQLSHKVWFLHQKPIYYPKGHSIEGLLAGFERKLKYVDFFDYVKDTEVDELDGCDRCPLRTATSYGCSNEKCHYGCRECRNVLPIHALIKHIPTKFRILGVHNTLQNGIWIFLRSKGVNYLCQGQLCRNELSYHRFQTTPNCSEQPAVDLFVNNYMPPEFQQYYYHRMPKDFRMFHFQDTAPLRNVSLGFDSSYFVRRLTTPLIILIVAVQVAIAIALLVCFLRRRWRMQLVRKMINQMEAGSRKMKFKSFRNPFRVGKIRIHKGGGGRTKKTSNMTTSNIHRRSTMLSATATTRTMTRTSRTGTLSRTHTTNTQVKPKATTKDKGNRESETITSVDQPYSRTVSPSHKK